jgi:hypothetical protein
MNKNQGLLLAIALILLFTAIALATSTTLTASSGDNIRLFYPTTINTHSGY